MEKNEYKSLNINGTKYRTLISKKFENRKVWEKPNEKLLISMIPGTILKILIKEGQKVKEGQRILILESMKVQNRILVPKNGVIKSINVKIGQKIPKDHLLIEFE